MRTAVLATPSITLALALLAGCVVGPDYHQPAVETPTAFSEPGPWKIAAPKDAWPKEAWWKAFGDPVLDSLEVQAASASPTLQGALARVDEAAAEARIARADLLPSVGVGLSPSRSRYSGHRQVPPTSTVQPYKTVSFDLPLAISYEIDLFGRARRGYESAKALAQAAAADYQNVLLSLQALLAEDYFSLRSLLAQDELLVHTVALRQQALDLVRTRRAGGAADDLDVYQAESDLDSVVSSQLAAAREVANLRRTLAVLSGHLPESSPLEAKPLTGEPPAIPSGLPSELLERRPDVAAAERELASANAEIGFAKAAFFPSIGLTSFAGFNSTAFNSLIGSSSREWSIAPFVSIPLFSGGRNLAAYRRSQAAYEEAVATYRGQVLVAFEDVETGFSDLSYLTEQLAAVSHAAEDAGKAADLSQARYKNGVTDYFEVIDAQRTALANQLQAVDLQGQRFVASILLVKALGGGW